MAWALATAGKSSVRHTARGKANSKRRLVINLCKKDFMSFYQFSTGFLYRPIVYHLYPNVKAHLPEKWSDAHIACSFLVSA